MRRLLGACLLAACVLGTGAASADVRAPSDRPEEVIPADPSPEPAPTARGGTLVHKPVLAGLIAMLFLVMGGLAANDRHKKAANSKRA